MSKKLTHHSPHFQLIQERQRHHLLRHLPLFPCPSNVVEPVLSNWNLVNPSFDDGGSSLSSTTDMPLMPVSLSGSHACKCQAPLGPLIGWRCHGIHNYDVSLSLYKWRSNTPHSFPTMSLPPTQKDISQHPAQASVADPVNQAEASQDVERKVSILSLRLV